MASNKLHKHYLSTHKASNFAINILKNILKNPCFQVSFLQFPKHKFLSLLWHEIALSNFGDCLAPKNFWVFFALSRTGTSIISGSSNGHCHVSEYIKYTYFPEGAFKATIRHSTEVCCDSANANSDSQASLTGLKILRLTGSPPFLC